MSLFARIRETSKNALPASVVNLLRFVRDWRDFAACMSFVRDDSLRASFNEKLRIVRQMYVISLNVQSPHTQSEILYFVKAILSIPEQSRGAILEAGCFKGSSSAKFSLAASIVNKRLMIFDSFEGIPENNEAHNKNIFGGDAKFEAGSYRGSLEEVKANIAKFGDVYQCDFHKGWLEDTLPQLDQPIAAAYLDVDLASSTRTCLKFIYPLLEDESFIFSQDGHLPLVIDVFEDDSFWRNEIGCEKPVIKGLGSNKVIVLQKR